MHTVSPVSCSRSLAPPASHTHLRFHTIPSSTTEWHVHHHDGLGSEVSPVPVFCLSFCLLSPHFAACIPSCPHPHPSPSLSRYLSYLLPCTSLLSFLFHRFHCCDLIVLGSPFLSPFFFFSTHPHCLLFFRPILFLSFLPHHSHLYLPRPSSTNTILPDHEAPPNDIRPSSILFLLVVYQPSLLWLIPNQPWRQLIPSLTHLTS
ncbi:hypothetical protein B0T13DRAFT_93878 [Neurospora crassa]|nr:hypothetical protein B0T13DRAFT_93878 [Neurospora crassa]